MRRFIPERARMSATSLPAARLHAKKKSAVFLLPLSTASEHSANLIQAFLTGRDSIHVYKLFSVELLFVIYYLLFMIGSENSATICD